MEQYYILVPSSEKWKCSTRVPLKTLLTEHQYHLPLQHLAQKMLLYRSKKDNISQFQVNHMSSADIKEHKTFQEQVIK